jgi:hypothetical protein
MDSLSEDQKRTQADLAEAAYKATVVFRFNDSDLVEIERLKAEGFKFVSITMRDSRGFQRAFALWVPPCNHDFRGHSTCWNCGSPASGPGRPTIKERSEHHPRCHTVQYGSPPAYCDCGFKADTATEPEGADEGGNFDETGINGGISALCNTHGEEACDCPWSPTAGFTASGDDKHG